MGIIGGILFLYLIWRNLLDDYQSDELISYGWSSLMVFLLGGRITDGLWNWGQIGGGIGWNWLAVWRIDQINLYGGLVAVFLWTWWYCVKNNWKLWSLLEDITPIYYFTLVIFLAQSFANGEYSWIRALPLLMVLGGFLLSKLVKGRYRSMGWYKSGKKGFVFFFTNIVMCWLLVVNGIITGAGWVMVSAYIIMSLIFVMGLVMLGELYVTKK